MRQSSAGWTAHAVLLGLSLGACGGSGGSAGSGVGAPAPSPAPTASGTPAPGTPVITDGVAIGQTAPAILTIGYIERLPRMDYVWNSGSPATEGWPAEGQPVTWRAHLRNWSSSPVGSVDYAWALDAAPLAAGTISLPAGAEMTLDLPWSWTRARHELELHVDSANRYSVPGGPRNRLRVYTDALSLGVYVERSFYDYFREHQHELRVGNSCFEDWMNFQVEAYNLLLARAIYPETPDGVHDRIRLDEVTIVGDGTLPLDPEAASVGGSFSPEQARPNLRDRSVDLQWGFPSAVLDSSPEVYNDHTSLSTANQFYYSGFVQHELGHARYLIDVYGFQVYHGTNGSRVDITENGQAIAGTAYMPGQPTVYNGKAGLLLHDTPIKGLMNAQWTFLDRHSAGAWNRIAGQRARLGNYNEPENIGAYLYDLPQENELAVEDSSGQPLSGAAVSVYQSTQPDEPGVYAKYYDDHPDIQLRADAAGRVLLGHNPFSADGRFVHSDVGYSNVTIIVRVEHEGKVGYGFLEAADFNYQYWQGHTDLGHYELRVPLI
jgi:hypothetical protein